MTFLNLKVILILNLKATLTLINFLITSKINIIYVIYVIYVTFLNIILVIKTIIT